MKKLVFIFCVLFSVLGEAQTWTNYNSNSGLAGDIVSSIAIDEQGNKWIGAYYVGISKFNGNSWTNYVIDQIKGDYVRSIAVDNQGNKWFGTYGKGVYKFDGTTWTTYSISNGLGSDYVLCIAIDAQGNKWFGTDSGISKFDGTTWTNYRNPNEYSSNVVSSIAIDGQGNKWLGTINGGVYVFDGNTWTNYTTANGLVSGNVYSIAIDVQGNKWFGTDGGVSKFSGKTWTTYKVVNGLIGEFITSIVIDESGNKWFGTDSGVTTFDDIKWVSYTTINGLAHNYIRSITLDTEGNKWFGTGGGGVSKFFDGGSGPLLSSKGQIGLVYNDFNTNGKKDPNETTIAGQIVKVDNNYTTTQNNGLFYTSLTNGTHTFTYRPQANWKLTTDSSITISVNDTPIKDSLYFGVQAIVNKHEVETKLTGTATRAGFESKSWVNYTNLGTLAENGTVSYTIADESSLVQTIPVPDSVIGKRLVWKYSNLIPNEQRQISITTQMPGVNSLGDTLVTISKIKSAFAENSDTLKQVLTGSYDPNDKLVAQGIGSKGYVLFGKELEYTVRFQNTGTDTAFNVNIRDTLDLNLDVASLQIVASSHPVKLDLRGQNEATFRFENILLPDSNVNQLGSNGFVKYTIRPKKNLPENTSVKNKAHIYFDFNPAIITNETENTYVSKLPSVLTGIYGFQSNKSASIFPNPAKDEFTIVFLQTGNYEVSLSNIQGKNIRTWNEFQGIETTLSLDGVEPGMYLYTAQSRNGQKYMGKVVVR